jgi:hypothetical protein
MTLNEVSYLLDQRIGHPLKLPVSIGNIGVPPPSLKFPNPVLLHVDICHQSIDDTLIRTRVKRVRHVPTFPEGPAQTTAGER